MAALLPLLLCSSLCLPPQSMPENGAAAPPAPGFIGYCMRDVSACAPAPLDEPPPDDTSATWAVLRQVNEGVNRAIPYRANREQFGIANVWSSENLAAGGDCKAYALAKQLALAKAGFSRRSLRLAVVRTEDGQLHAVLTVRVAEGDYVLDNRRREILPWDRTGYRWLSRQSAGDPLDWRLVGSAAG